MKKLLITLLILLAAQFAFADSIMFDSFEYANHEGESPVGWVCDDNSFMCGYLEKDHNRIAHHGNWYVYTNNNESWMFMQIYMNPELKYRYSYWAISDGSFNVEVWAGNAPNAENMTVMLYSSTVNSGDYEKFSYYVESIASDYPYFGIRATTTDNDCYLTIDEVNVDMVGKYDISVEPYSYSTIAEPGSQVEFNCRFTNLGYEPSNVLISCYSEDLSDIHLYKNGVACTSFHVEPDESVDFTGVATLTSNITTGTMVFADIIFALDCDCATTMYTLWVTAGYESIGEYNITTMSIYPNPSTGMLTIEGTGLVTITNTLGQVVLRKEITDKECITLDKGVYFIKKDNGPAQKIIIEP